MKGLQIASYLMAFVADSFVEIQETCKWPCKFYAAFVMSWRILVLGSWNVYVYAEV
jgi:hypothetical protein